MIDLDILERLPDEPFKVRHNGFEAIGGFVQVTETGFTYWNGERTIEVGETYEVSQSDGKMTFTSRTYESVIEISDLSLSDKHLLLYGEDATTFPELRLIAIGALRASIQTPSYSLSDTE